MEEKIILWRDIIGQGGYAVSTVGFEETKIRSYIQNQEQLDRKGTEDSGMFKGATVYNHGIPGGCSQPSRLPLCGSDMTLNHQQHLSKITMKGETL